jgi:hypothetical protein
MKANNAPYGEKDLEKLRRRRKDGVKFFEYLHLAALPQSSSSPIHYRAVLCL